MRVHLRQEGPQRINQRTKPFAKSTQHSERRLLPWSLPRAELHSTVHMAGHTTCAVQPPPFPQPLPVTQSPGLVVIGLLFLVTSSPLKNLYLFLSCPAKQSPNTSVYVQGPKLLYKYCLHHYSSVPFALAQPPHLLFPKFVQNAKPLSPAQADTSAWSGGPCISTNKLKVSFRS